MASKHEGTAVEMLLRGFHLPTMAALYEPTMVRAEKEGWSHHKKFLWRSPVPHLLGVNHGCTGMISQKAVHPTALRAGC